MAGRFVSPRLEKRRPLAVRRDKCNRSHRPCTCRSWRRWLCPQSSSWALRGGFSFRTDVIGLAFRADGKKRRLFPAHPPVGPNGYFASPGLTAINPELVRRTGARPTCRRSSSRRRGCPPSSTWVAARPSRTSRGRASRRCKQRNSREILISPPAQIECVGSDRRAELSPSIPLFGSPQEASDCHVRGRRERGNAGSRRE